MLGFMTGLLKGDHGLEHFTFPAYFHLLAPAFLCLALTNRPINEPAKIFHLEFPRWTVLPDLGGTLSYRPTGSFLSPERLFRG